MSSIVAFVVIVLKKFTIETLLERHENYACSSEASDCLSSGDS